MPYLYLAGAGRAGLWGLEEPSVALVGLLPEVEQQGHGGGGVAGGHPHPVDALGKEQETLSHEPGVPTL